MDLLKYRLLASLLRDSDSLSPGGKGVETDFEQLSSGTNPDAAGQGNPLSSTGAVEVRLTWLHQEHVYNSVARGLCDSKLINAPQSSCWTRVPNLKSPSLDFLAFESCIYRRNYWIKNSAHVCLER